MLHSFHHLKASTADRVKNLMGYCYAQHLLCYGRLHAILDHSRIACHPAKAASLTLSMAIL